MKLTHLMTAAAVATLIGGAAYAQSQSPTVSGDNTPAAAQQPGQADTPPTTGDANSGSMSNGAQGSTAGAPAAQYNYNANSGSGSAPASSSTLGDPATMKAGDASVVSNGPVPDTRENRARYGRPMSNAGKKSAPAGN